MGNYKLTPEADCDLTEVWKQGYKRWGLKRANLYLLDLEDCFEKLFELPKLGIKRDNVLIGCRSFPQGSHIVFYRKHNKKIEVIRVLHRRMEVRMHFD